MSNDALSTLRDEILDYPNPKSVYINVSFYDEHLRKEQHIVRLEYGIDRTIMDIPFFIIADKRHPNYRII